MSAKRAGIAMLLALGLAGCGKELLVGGQKHVDARATGDGTPEGAASHSRAPAYAVAPADAPVADHVAGRAQGTVTFAAKISLISDDGRVVELNPSPDMATVRIDGDDTVRVASRNVPERRYTAVRVAFTEARADVTGGLVVGGINVTGRVNVAVGDSIVVQRAVDLGPPEADVRLLIDLDASAWLRTTNPATRIVAAAAFQQAVKIRTY